MTLFWFAVVLVSGLSVASAACGLREPACKGDQDEHSVFACPRALRLFSVVVPPLAAAGLLAYMYTQTQRGASTFGLAVLATAAIGTSLLSLLASIEASTAHFIVSEGKLTVVGVRRREQIDLNEIDAVITYGGHIAVRFRNGRVRTLSGYMAWSGRFRRHLVALVTANKISRLQKEH